MNETKKDKPAPHHYPRLARSLGKRQEAPKPPPATVGHREADLPAMGRPCKPAVSE
jgi:hypothetical protein